LPLGFPRHQTPTLMHTKKYSPSFRVSSHRNATNWRLACGLSGPFSRYKGSNSVELRTKPSTGLSISDLRRRADLFPSFPFSIPEACRSLLSSLIRKKLQTFGSEMPFYITLPLAPSRSFLSSSAERRPLLCGSGFPMFCFPPLKQTTGQMARARGTRCFLTLLLDLFDPDKSFNIFPPKTSPPSPPLLFKAIGCGP